MEDKCGAQFLLDELVNLGPCRLVEGICAFEDVLAFHARCEEAVLVSRFRETQKLLETGFFLHKLLMDSTTTVEPQAVH